MNRIKLALFSIITLIALSIFSQLGAQVMSNTYVKSDKTYHLFWDTKTGNSQLYSWDSYESKYVAGKIGLPDNPLGEVKGKVMVNTYIKSGKTYHLFWDTQTGNSKLYSWDSYDSKYVAGKIGLPNNPLENVEGDVMVSTYVKSGKTYHLFWDTKTGDSQLYRWDSDKSKYVTGQVGLPDGPLKECTISSNQ